MVTELRVVRNPAKGRITSDGMGGKRISSKTRSATPGYPHCSITLNAQSKPSILPVLVHAGHTRGTFGLKGDESSRGRPTARPIRPASDRRSLMCETRHTSVLEGFLGHQPNGTQPSCRIRSRERTRAGHRAGPPRKEPRHALGGAYAVPFSGNPHGESLRPDGGRAHPHLRREPGDQLCSRGAGHP